MAAPRAKARLRKAYVAASYLELTDHQTRARRSVAKEALGCSVLPLRGKTGGLFRILGSLHPDGPETLGICLWDAYEASTHKPPPADLSARNSFRRSFRFQ